jgi:hypothetical protein
MYVCSNEYSLDHEQYCSLSDVDMYTNHDMVEKAFEECDLTHEGRSAHAFIHTYIYAYEGYYQLYFCQVDLRRVQDVGGENAPRDGLHRVHSALQWSVCMYVCMCADLT